MKQVQTAPREWLLLSYSIPREPSARRVYVWRKLKSLNAQAVQGAVWALPLSERNREHLQWLATEIEEMKGQAAVWVARPLSRRQDEKLLKSHREPIDRIYREILAALRKGRPDLRALSRRFQQAQMLGDSGNRLAEEVRRRLVKGRGGSTK